MSRTWRPPCAVLCVDDSRAPKDHINTRISHSGSKAHDKGDTGNHVL